MSDIVKLMLLVCPSNKFHQIAQIYGFNSCEGAQKTLATKGASEQKKKGNNEASMKPIIFSTIY
jgi:hypothetical protein